MQGRRKHHQCIVHIVLGIVLGITDHMTPTHLWCRPAPLFEKHWRSPRAALWMGQSWVVVVRSGSQWSWGQKQGGRFETTAQLLWCSTLCSKHRLQQQQQQLPEFLISFKSVKLTDEKEKKKKPVIYSSRHLGLFFNSAPTPNNSSHFCWLW